MKRLFTLLILMNLIFSCSRDMGVNNCRIVKMHNLIEKDLDKHLDEIFTYKRFIILDTLAKEYPYVINKLLYRNGKLFIQNDNGDDSDLLVYDDNGDFLFKVGDRGRARNEYLGIDDFDVNDKGEIFINDIVSNEILKFNEKGEFIENITPPYKDVYSIKNISNDDFLLCLASWTTTDPKKELIRVNSNKNEAYTYYGKYLDENLELDLPRFTKIEENVYFKNALNDTVYRFNQDGELTERVYFDFGNRAIPAEKKANLEEQFIKGEYENFTTLMNFCCVDGNYVYGGLFDGMLIKSFVLDENKGTIYKLDNDKYSEVGQIIGFDNKYLISYLDNLSYNQNPDAFNEEVAGILKNDRIVICLYSK